MDKEIVRHLNRFKKDGLTAEELTIEIYLIGRDNKHFEFFKEKVKKELRGMDVIKKKGIYFLPTKKK